MARDLRMGRVVLCGWVRSDMLGDGCYGVQW